MRLQTDTINTVDSTFSTTLARMKARGGLAGSESSSAADRRAADSIGT